MDEIIEEKQNEAYNFEAKMDLKRAIPLGMQHVLAMFISNLTPIIIVCGACGIVSGSELQIALLQNAMFIAGVVTLLQLFPIGPIGGRVPIVMGTSTSFVGSYKSILASIAPGAGIVAYGTILGAGIVGGLFECVIGFFIKPLRKIFTSVVTGTVVIAIGMSLISVGINSFGGGKDNIDFGSPENLCLAFIVLATILLCKHFGKGFISNSAILIGIIVGYVVAFLMGLFVPHTAIGADGVEYTKSWVLNFDGVATAGWFSLPKLMPVKPVFNFKEMIPILMMFVVTAVETVGDVSAVVQGGFNRNATDKELSGGVVCDGFGSALAAVFGVLPNTSFSQNVGLVSMTKVVNRIAIASGAVFVILCGFIPKLGAFISSIPSAVLGGAIIMMFSTIIVSGIELVTSEKLTSRNITIISVALGVGYGMGSNSTILQYMPDIVAMIFGGSGIVPAAIVAVLLNIILPKDN